MTAQLFATFHLGNSYLGIDALQVQEVARAQPMSPVPLAPPEVRGLINLRGQIVTAIDVRQRLGLGTTEPDRIAQLMNVVVHTDDGPVSLLVDDIAEVIEIAPGEIGEVPETMRDIDRSLVLGIHERPDELLVLLDVHLVAAPRAAA